MLRSLVFSVLSLGVLAPAPAFACDSVDTCVQALVCKSGSTVTPHAVMPYVFHCVDKVPAQTVLPVCAPFRDNTDWRYDSGSCSRTNANGTTVTTTENVRCPPGSSSAMPANMPVVACQIPARTDYTNPALLAPGSTAKARFTEGTATASYRMIYCRTGGVKKTGANYYCELYLTSPRSTTPTCSDLGGNKWTFDASSKKCTRKSGTTSFENTANIECEAGATYNASTGKCVTPKGTFYDEPVLVSID